MSIADDLHDLFRHNSPGTAVALGMELIREQFKKMKTENQFHNPENLTPQQYGASEGWRLLLKGELGTKPEGVQFKRDYMTSWDNCLPYGVINDGVSYRTRAPLPNLSVLPAASSQWIKMSDRKPTEADLPVIFGGFYGEEASAWTQIYCGNLLMTNSSWTHWTPQLKVPPPPAKEPTRQEEDGEAFRCWRNNTMDDISAAPAFVAGFKYERASLRLLLDKYTANSITIQQLVAEIKERAR